MEPPAGDLVQQITSAAVVCGQAWGGPCTHLVGPPSYSHDQHGIYAGRTTPNPGCPPQVLIQMAAHPSAKIRAGVARARPCPPEALRILCADPDLEVRRRVALNPNCPPDVLDRLANAPEHQLQEDVLRNRGCPSQTIRRLRQAAAEGLGAALAMARNPNTPPDILADLFDSDNRVTTLVVANPQCPPDVLVRALQWKLRDVREAALANPNLPEEYRMLGRVAQ